ncbi:MAG: TolB family protein, partial [Acidobacteriota bacterium]
MLPFALGILTILFAGLAALFYFTREPKKAELIRLSMMPEEKSRISGQIAISPDGQKIAFVAKRIGEEVALWVREMDKLEAKQLPGTRDASLPFWSPDSRHLGFFASGKLKRIDIEEGPPQTLSDAPSGRGGTWNQEGTILFSPNFTSTPLYKIPASGGKPEKVTELGTSAASHIDPVFLPDGKHFLYRGSIEGTRAILLGSLDSPQNPKMLLKDPARAEYSSGHIVFVRERTLLAQPFDAKTLELSGEPKPIIDKIGFDGSNYSFSTAPNQTLIYTSVDSVSTQLIWMDREGKQLGALTPDPGSYLEPYFAPDEKKVVIGRLHDSSIVNMWIVDPLRQSLNRFTVAATNQYAPVWSPDGKTIVFSWAGPNRPNFGFDLYEKPASGAGAEKVLVNSSQSEFTDDWSADGQHIIYELDDPKTKYDLWYIPMLSGRKARP